MRGSRGLEGQVPAVEGPQAGLGSALHAASPPSFRAGKHRGDEVFEGVTLGPSEPRSPGAPARSLARPRGEPRCRPAAGGAGRGGGTCRRPARLEGTLPRLRAAVGGLTHALAT